MKIKIMLFLLALIACQNKKDNDNLISLEKSSADSLNQNNSLIIKLKNNIMIFRDIATTGDTENVNADYSIRNLEKHKVLIEGAFLESDLLDGKTVVFSNKNTSNVKVKFFYNMVFKGDEKKTINVGLTFDTLINLQINNKKIKIPKFVNIRADVLKKFQNESFLEKAFEIGMSYFKQNETEEVYLSYLNKINKFKNGKKSIEKLEELSIDIDYKKFEIEFADEKSIRSKIIYDRGFDENDNLKDDQTSRISSLKDVLLKNYKIKKEVKCDLNQDGFEDVVIIFEPQTIKKLDSNNSLLMDSPFYVLINKGDNKYSVITNKNIIYTAAYNCPNYGIQELEVKDNLIVIEQGSCDDFSRLVKDNIIFKYNSNTSEISLDKYKRSLFERLDNSEYLPLSTTITAKDLGKVLFQDYDSKKDYYNL